MGMWSEAGKIRPPGGGYKPTFEFPGVYVCEITSIRAGASENPKKRGINRFIAEFRVLQATPPLGEPDAVLLPEGTDVGFARYLEGDRNYADSLSLLSAALGVPFSDVDEEMADLICANDGAVVIGAKVEVKVTLSRPKILDDGTEKQYTNVYFSHVERSAASKELF